MRENSNTNYHVLRTDRCEQLSKSQICKMQFRAYIAWAKGASSDHVWYKYYLQQARKLYKMYQNYARLENEPTLILEAA